MKKERECGMNYPVYGMQSGIPMMPSQPMPMPMGQPMMSGMPMSSMPMNMGMTMNNGASFSGDSSNMATRLNDLEKRVARLEGMATAGGTKFNEYESNFYMV